jgi:hypothetical protein
MASDPNHGKRSPRPLQVKEALGQILRSAPFNGSKQSQTLLKYLVEHSLGEEGDSLKERTIGIEVFGRKPDYNTAEDPIVRARVGEIRKRLAQYYQSPEAQDSALHIFILPGSYRPTFALHPGENDGSQDGAVTDQTETVDSHTGEDHASPKTAALVARAPGKARWRIWAVAAPAVCVVLLVAWIGIQKWTKSDLDLFWGPILDSKRPVVIYAGTAPVYVRTMESYYSKMPPLQPGEEKQPALKWTLPSLAEQEVLTAKDVLVDTNGYVEVGDVTAVSNVTGLLNGHQHKFDLRLGPDLAFEDLHGSPTILVGSFANFWTMNMNPDLRFYFDRDLNIRERGGQGRVWSISHGASRARSSTITEDYAIISRLLDSKTGAPVITLAGTTTCGARAASEFVTDPVQMRQLDRIPKDNWEHKNLELVLHTSLIDCNPTSMDLVTWQSW